MKNKLIVILTCVMLGLIMTGCGSDTNDSESGDNAPEIEKDFKIEMTDSYIYTDPEGLDFDQRYVLVGNEGSKLLSDMANFGYTATTMYDIVYASEGTPVAEYQYFVCPDEASASELADFYTSQGQQIIQEGNVIYASIDGDTLQASIMMLSSSGALSDDTLEAYIDMQKSFNDLMDY